MYGETVLLTHGDLLCTDDTRYLTLRATLRDPTWQSEFLAKPLSERRMIAEDLRKLSATEIAAKAEDIMDVNQAAVEETMRRFGVGSSCMAIRTDRPCTASRWTVMPLSASCSAPGTSKAPSSRGTRLEFSPRAALRRAPRRIDSGSQGSLANIRSTIGCNAECAAGSLGRGACACL